MDTYFENVVSYGRAMKFKNLGIQFPGSDFYYYPYQKEENYLHILEMQGVTEIHFPAPVLIQLAPVFVYISENVQQLEHKLEPEKEFETRWPNSDDNFLKYVFNVNFLADIIIQYVEQGVLSRQKINSIIAEEYNKRN